MSKNKLSAVDFVDPLLRVLGAMTQFRAGVTVVGSETYFPVMTLMGIKTIDEHGINEGSGQPMVAKWIQWANTHCRTKVTPALTQIQGRNKWALTTEGALKARVLEDSNGALTTMTMNHPSFDAPKMPPPGVQVAPSIAAGTLPAPKVQGPTSAPTVAARVMLYHEDAYVVSLAIEATGCFGKFSPHGGAECQNCPLRVECRNKQLANLGSFAATFITQEQAAGRPDPVTPPVADMKASSTYDSSIFDGADIIINKAETICQECGKSIDQDERVRWVEEMPGSGDGALFHLGCSGGEE